MILSYQIFLFVGAVCTMIYFLRQISRKRLNIENAVFWSIFSGILVLLSVFPQIMFVGARWLGIESAVNLLFLIMLTLLIFYAFFTTVKISKLEEKIASLTQYIAIEKMNDASKKEE